MKKRISLKELQKLIPIFDKISNQESYAERVVDRTDVNGLTVSTAWTADEGFETAIIDAKGAYPVERYKDRNFAEDGHYKWCEEAKTVEEVLCLSGFGGLVEEITVKLERIKT